MLRMSGLLSVDRIKGDRWHTAEPCTCLGDGAGSTMASLSTIVPPSCPFWLSSSGLLFFSRLGSVVGKSDIALAWT